MNTLQKKFVITTAWIFLLTVFMAWMVRSQFDDVYEMKGFLHFFARYDLPAAILSAMILVTGMCLALKIKASWTEECFNWIGRNRTRIALIILAILSSGAYWIYFRYPLSMDEYMQYFQAQIFAGGRLWGRYPPELIKWLVIPDFFAVFSPETGRIISCYWPGYSVLLTPFMKFGIPWLLNPILGSGSLLLLHYYMRRIFNDPRAASWGIAMTVSSAVFMVNSISFYSMSAHLFFNLLFAVCLLKITPLRLFLAGLVGSYALVMHNPVPHIAFALPWIIWIITKEKRFRNIGFLLSGYLPLAIIMGVGWYWVQLFVSNAGADGLSGNLSSSIPTVKAGANLPSPNNFSLPAFFISKVSAMIGSVFALPDFSFMLIRLMGLLKTFVWALPGLPILAILGARHIKGSAHLKLWGWSAVSTLLIFLFVPFSQGHGWGFRYFYPTWFALPLLGAAFLTTTNLSAAAFWKRFFCMMIALSFVFGNGLRYFQVRHFMGQHLSQLPKFEKGKRYICFLKTDQGYYLHNMMQNGPFMGDPVILLRQIDEQKDRDMVQKLFPEAVQIDESSLYSVWEIQDKGGHSLVPKQKE